MVVCHNDVMQGTASTLTMMFDRRKFQARDNSQVLLLALKNKTKPELLFSQFSTDVFPTQN